MRSLEAVLEADVSVSGIRRPKIENIHRTKVVGNGRYSGTG